jgi:predicted transcriptional regulator
VKLTEKIKQLARDREVTESEILEQAIERGVEDLWTESVLSKYVEGEIDRERAVELVGLDRVKRADREVEAVEEDVEWGASA